MTGWPQGRWRWLRQIPTYVVIVWASAGTWVVVHNYNSVDDASRARTEAVCLADNLTRSIAAQLLAVGATGTDPAAARWQALQARLAGELVPTDCNTEK